MAKEGELVVRGVGRPSKITPELIQQAWDYLNITSSVSRGQLLPTIEGLALAIGVDRSTLQDWEKQKGNEFSIILDKLRSAQAEKLIQNALTGNYNPTIAKLLLSKHGYVEKTENDTNLKVVTPIMSLEEHDALPNNDSNEED